MPADLLTPQPVKQDYLAFLGRISPEKGVDKAIRIAGAAGMKLKVAAKVDNADKKYDDNEIKPLIDASPWVEFIGEINDSQKPAFLSGAHALLFPIDWPEPFGLVMIESMACGTPVIAFNRGSVPEVIDDGVSGFIVHDEASAIAAVDRLGELDRATVRATSIGASPRAAWPRTIWISTPNSASRASAAARRRGLIDRRHTPAIARVWLRGRAAHLPGPLRFAPEWRQTCLQKCVNATPQPPGTASLIQCWPFAAPSD